MPLRVMIVAWALLAGVMWMPQANAAVAPVKVPVLQTAGSPLLVSQRITVAPAQQRDRPVASGTFLRPEVRSGNRMRPSDYYQPPARDSEPFYHYRRISPPVIAPAYQRHLR